MNKNNKCNIVDALKVQENYIELISCKERINDSGIYSSQTNIHVNSKLFHSSMNPAIEIIDDGMYTKPYIPPSLNFNFEKCRMYKSHEGIIIRVFNVFDTWYISTLKKINSFNIRWSNDNNKSEKIGDTFFNNLYNLIDERKKEELNILKDISVYENKLEIMEKIFSIYLDKKNVYLFLLTNPEENRIVCDINENRIYNIGVFKDNKFFLEDISICNVVIKHPEEIHFDSIEDMFKSLRKINYNEYKGFYALQETDFGEYNIFNILNHNYVKLYSLFKSVREVKKSLLNKLISIDLKNPVNFISKINNSITFLYSNLSKNSFDDITTEVLDIYYGISKNDHIITINKKIYSMDFDKLLDFLILMKKHKDIFA